MDGGSPSLSLSLSTFFFHRSFFLFFSLPLLLSPPIINNLILSTTRTFWNLYNPSPLLLLSYSKRISRSSLVSGFVTIFGGSAALGNPPSVMAPPMAPTGEEGGESPAQQPSEGAQRSLPTPFLTKTYQLVDDSSVDDIISWNDDGSAFIVWRPAEFARDLLPKYFKHNNFSSFVRQLNTYGFRKIVSDRWEFANDCFRRGEKRLLCDIHRRKITPQAAPAPVPAATPITVAAPENWAGSPTNSGEEQVLSSNSYPGALLAPATAAGSAVELRDENERLRKENSRLSRELSQMKSLCNNIVLLMSKYASSQQQGGGGVEGGDLAAPPVLEPIPARRAAEEGLVKPEEVTSPPSPAGPCARLFGVSIGVKRLRGEDDGGADPPERAVAPEVKPEPLDPGSDPDRESWILRCPRPSQQACNVSDRVAGERERSHVS